jgi:hypothetical protein
MTAFRYPTGPRNGGLYPCSRGAIPPGDLMDRLALYFGLKLKAERKGDRRKGTP